MTFLERFIEKIVSVPEKKVLVENFSSLSLLQVANYILPLVTLPYLVRVLGPEKYGLIAFARAFIQYFIILESYGFDLSATREISINREDKDKVTEIFSSVIAIKITLMVISFLVLSSLVFTIPKLKNDWLIYFLTFGMVVGQTIFPVWFFQGMERMKYITFLNITAKLIFTISIFIFIRKTQHYIYVPLINSLGFLIVGALALWIVHKDFKIRFILPNFKSIKHQLKEGWHIFISKVSISLYTTSNTFILGLLTNNIIVGYYAAGEKIIRALIQLFEPLFQAAYPYISRIVTESRIRALNNLKKLFSLSFFVSFAIFIPVFIFSKNIVKIVLGNNFLESVIIIRIFSPLLIIIPAAYIMANLCLLPFKLDKYFSKIYILGGIINIVLLILLLGVFGLAGCGAALANLITETILTLMLYLVLRKHNIKIIL